MGGLVSFADDIEHLGCAFTTAAGDIGEALVHLQQASAHVRQAFHNHPDQASAAVGPFTKLHGSVDQVQQLVKALGRSLGDIATSYRDNDAAVAKGWERIPSDLSDPCRR